MIRNMKYDVEGGWSRSVYAPGKDERCIDLTGFCSYYWTSLDFWELEPDDVAVVKSAFEI